MAQVRPLHELVIFLPDEHRVRHPVLGSRASMYRWPCGCNANGHDPKALEVRFCRPHHDMLSVYSEMSYDLR